MLIIAGQKKVVDDAIRRIVNELSADVAKDLRGIRDMADLSGRVKELREQVEKLEVEKARKTEEFNRREREVEHKVGLERKRSTFEVESAKREAILSVREENLAADRERFEEQIRFHEDRFTKEVGYLKELMGQIMKRLPDINITGELGGKRRGKSD